MLRLKFVFIAVLALSLAGCTNKNEFEGAHIALNSLGYMPNANKIATLVTKNAKFNLIDVKSGRVVYSGKASGPIFQSDVNQNVYLANFSEFKTPGNYYLQVDNNVKSVEFTIANTVYNTAFETSMRAFYLWRCGIDVQGTYNGQLFSQKACHHEDGWLNYTPFGNKFKDATGGWHDAGDYGKYTVNAGFTLGLLFMAWEQFEPQLSRVNLNLPDTSLQMPDYLKELKWEMDWMLKMQYPDHSGCVSHKVTRINFEGFVMPDADTGKRYFADWGTTATAHFAASMAQAARAFKPFDLAYSQTCLDAATLSYKVLQKHPEFVEWDQKEFHTGGYHAPDAEPRMWAAIEMWETTGDPIYLTDFEQAMLKETRKVDWNWDWGNPKNLAAFRYILSKQSGRNAELVTLITQQSIATADSIVANISTDVYGRPLNNYAWGCNGTVARMSSNLYVAYALTGDPIYKQAGAEIISHLFGRNVYNRSYVTGLGINPPKFPHDRRSGADSITEPWPGYIVGGGHTALDWLDEQGSYQTNEIAINWQAALVFNLAWFIE